MISSCSKEKWNERKIAGVWKLDHISTSIYDQNGNETIVDSTISNATLQLQNTDDLSNYAYFENWDPVGNGGVALWDINFGKLHEINFYFEEGFVEYDFNVEKCTNKKLILTAYSSDDSLNLEHKLTWFFKR